LRLSCTQEFKGIVELLAEAVEGHDELEASSPDGLRESGGIRLCGVVVVGMVMVRRKLDLTARYYHCLNPSARATSQLDAASRSDEKPR
jgi:hypothetical protein